MSNLNVKRTLTELGLNNLANISLTPIFEHIEYDLLVLNDINVMSTTLLTDISSNKDVLKKLQTYNDILSGELKPEDNSLRIITKSVAIPIISYLIIISFIAVSLMVLTGYAKVDGAIAGSILGYISAKAEQIISYYFGNSNSAQEKDIMLANSIPANPIATKPSAIEKLRGKK